MVDPTQNWGANAEGSFGRIFAGLLIRDAEAQWASALAEAQLAGVVLAIQVTPLEAAMLQYRMTPRSVESFVFSGVDVTDERVAAEELAFWRSAGLM